MSTMREGNGNSMPLTGGRLRKTGEEEDKGVEDEEERLEMATIAEVCIGV